MIDDFVHEGELTETFRQWYAVCHRESLLGDDGSRIGRLLEQTLADRLERTEAFYSFYREVVADAYDAIAAARPELAATADGNNVWRLDAPSSRRCARRGENVSGLRHRIRVP